MVGTSTSAPRAASGKVIGYATDENDQVDAAGAKAILESDRVRAWRDAGSIGEITGTLKLAEPISAGVVPPAALFAPSSDTPCLVDETGIPTPIEVLASQLGSTLVRPGSAEHQLPQRVQLDIDGRPVAGEDDLEEQVIDPG